MIMPKKKPTTNCKELISIVFFNEETKKCPWLVGYFDRMSHAEKYLDEVCLKYTVQELSEKLGISLKEAMRIEFSIKNRKVKPNRPDLLGLPDEYLDPEKESMTVIDMFRQIRFKDSPTDE